MITLAALFLGLGLVVVGTTALWLLVRVGALHEPRWSAAMRSSHPPLQRAVVLGIGYTCGMVVAASSFLIVDLVYGLSDPWIGQARGLLVSTGSLMVGALLFFVLSEIAHLRQRRKPPRKNTR